MCFLITAPQAYRRALQQMDFTPGTTGRGGRESTGAKTLIAALARNDNSLDLSPTSQYAGRPLMARSGSSLRCGISAVVKAEADITEMRP
jgi:hypothetical protein